MQRNFDTLHRREMLAAGGLAASFALFSEATAQTNPAGSVADRTTRIRLTNVIPTSFGAKTVVKLETNLGVTGCGEVSQLPPATAKPLIQSMFQVIQDENPTRIEHLWQKLFRAHRDFRGGPFMMHTIAGFDMAL